MRRYVIDRIDGLPPKKDGANSMWNKGVELPRLVLLRNAVFGALDGNPPLSKNVSLVLRVHVGTTNPRSVGDLDNFITGICDGLQAAHPGMKVANRWIESDCANIHPHTSVGILDDVEVVSIDARKVLGDETQWYSLELTGD
jgi:hypothetical protein